MQIGTRPHRLSILEKDTWNTSWQEVYLNEERIIEMISVRFRSVTGGDVSLYVGMMRIEERITPPVAVTSVQSTGDPWFSTDGNEAAFNLAWDAVPGAMYYDLYRGAGAGEKIYCGRALVPVFNFHRFARNNETKSCVSVIAVNSAGYEGEPATFELLWK